MVELRKEELDPTEMLIEQLALLADISPTDDVFEEMTLDELLEITNQMRWLAREPHSTEVTVIEGMRAKKMQNLTLGEFIDLEYWIADYHANMHRILAILYKRFREDEWGNEIEEPYIYDVEERSNLFLQEPVTKVWYALRSYLEFKENFVKSYTDLFTESNDEEPESEAEQILNAQEKLAQRKAEAEEKVRSRWSWESILWSLSEGDVTKYDALFQSKVILIFNILAMKKSLNL